MRKRALNPFHLSRLPAFLAAALPAILLMVGCGDNDNRLKYSFLRGAAQFQVDTARTNQGCDDPGPNFRSDGFDPSATCRSLRKFIFTWQMPDDTAKFIGYRLYLDTTPPPRNQSWKATQGDDREAAVIIQRANKRNDTLIFFFFDARNPPPGIKASESDQDTLYPGSSRVFGIDSSGRLETDKERFIFALATRFTEGTPGLPQYIQIITGDKLRPMPFHPAMRIGARDLEITWARPGDMVSDFNRAMDTGIIQSYYFSMKLYGGRLRERSAAFQPDVEFLRGGVKVEDVLLDSIVMDAENYPTERRYFLPDGGRAGRGVPGIQDSLTLRISKLVPQDSLDLVLYALDSAGNNNAISMPEKTTVILTDTTRPSKPKLTLVDSLTSENSLVLEWTASRDSMDSDKDGKLEPTGRPNDSIDRYLLSRILKRASGESAEAFDRRDTVIQVTDQNRGKAVFRETIRFLPPGKAYVVTLTAVDRSGFASETDSAEFATDSIRFSGGDSGHTCPPGFIPIPEARFRFGDSTKAGESDEKTKAGGSRPVLMKSFCIEPYEHRDSLGNFVNRVTWEEADQICRELSADDDSRLCSEAEWERACEGFNFLDPHPHGIQSETAPNILQSSCNQATGDSAMAMSFDLRNPVCLTNEGVFDMAGNLSEWVRDPYNDQGLENLKDSVLGHDFSFPLPATGDTVRSIRGGNFLKSPSLPLAKMQSLARCSNRDYPMPIRPKVRPDCVDSLRAKVAVVYGEGLDNVRCYDLPESLRGVEVTDVTMDARDSVRILIHYFTADASKPKTDTILADTAFRGKKPLEALLTPLSLAEVIFERVANPDSGAVKDTLDAREMQHASESDLKRILDRESPSRAWAPRKVDGRYAIRKLYAYAVNGTKPAKSYLASRNIGFRCCSRSRPPAPTTPATKQAAAAAENAAATIKETAVAGKRAGSSSGSDRR